MSQTISLLQGADEAFGTVDTTATSTWTEIVPADPHRTLGVLLQNITATAETALIRTGTSLPGVGVTTGFKLKAAYTETTVLGNDSFMFLATGDAVYAKDDGPATVNTIAYLAV